MPRKTFIKNFKELTKKDIDIAGGKGASLGEMTQTGIPVPSGFVILASAFERYLEEIDLGVAIDAELEKINFQDTNSVDRASNVIRDLIHDQVIPPDISTEILKQFKRLKSKYVAIRSSATAEDSSVASWAGELESYLDTTQNTLTDNIMRCWSSLFTPRALFYRHEKKLFETKVSVAVVVQQMVQSEVSGICFTVHPVTQDHDQMIIEAGWGLGEAIVSGQITPDSYVLDKRDLSLSDINISKQEMMIVRKSPTGVQKTKVPSAKQEQQKLEGKYIIELAKICMNIEKHYGCPQDIEWAFLKNKFFVVQSRPITTLK